MHLSAPFIKRPVATSLLSLALLLAGSVAYSLLPVASLPNVDMPVIYLYFDKLAQRMKPRELHISHEQHPASAD